MTTDAQKTLLTRIRLSSQKRKEAQDARQLVEELRAVQTRVEVAKPPPTPNNWLLQQASKLMPYQAAPRPDAVFDTTDWVTSRRAALDALTPEVSRDVLGIELTSTELDALRANPERVLSTQPPPVQQRLNQYAYTHYRKEKAPSPEQLDLVKKIYNLTDDPDKPSLLRRVFGTDDPVWTALFGDGTQVEQGPMAMLGNESDQTAYLKSKGILGALYDAATAFYDDYKRTQAGITSVAVGNAIYTLTGESSEFKERYNTYREKGWLDVEAARRAYDETDFKKYTKGVLETISDPLIVLPLLKGFAGIATVAASEGPRVAVTVATEGVREGVAGAREILDTAYHTAAEADWVRGLSGLPALPLAEKTRGLKTLEAIRGLHPPKPGRSMAGGSPVWTARQGSQIFVPRSTTNAFADDVAGLNREHWWRAETPKTPDATLLIPKLSEDVSNTSKGTWLKSWMSWAVHIADPAGAAASAYDKAYIGSLAWTHLNTDRALASSEELWALTARLLDVREGGRMGSVALRGAPKFDEKYKVSNTWWDFLATPYNKLDAWWTGVGPDEKKLYVVARTMIDDLGKVRVSEGVLKKEDMIRNFVPHAFNDRSAYDELRKAVHQGSAREMFQQSRAFQTIAQGMRAGVDYRADPVGVWRAQVQATYRAAGEKRLLERMKDEGLVVDVANLQSRKRQVGRLIDSLSKVTDTSRKYTKRTLTKHFDRLLRSGQPDIVDATTKHDIAALTALKDVYSVERGRLDSAERSAIRGLPKAGGGRFALGYTVRDEELGKKILNVVKTGALDELFDPKGLAGAAKTATSWLRQITTTYDMSASFLQGLPLLFVDPANWAKGYKAQWLAFFDDTYRGRWVATNVDDILDASRAGVMFGSTEFTEALSRKPRYDPASTAMQKVRKLVKAPVVASMSPFNRAFNAYGDVARLELYKSMRAAFGEKDVIEVAAFVNTITGQFNSARIGVSTAQQALESLMFWSPRYNRAGLALLKNTFEGSLRGDVARKSLIGFAGVGGMLYMMSSALFDQDPKLDPRPVNAGGDGAEFMTWEVGSMRVGPGSWWLSMARLLGALILKPATADYETWQDVHEAAGSLVDDSIRFVRSKLGPTTGTAWDTAVGRTFLGEHLANPLDDPLGYAKSLAKYEADDRLLPFLATDIIEAGGLDPGVIAAGFSGFRTFPEPLFERLDAIDEELVSDKAAEFGIYDATLDEWRAGKLPLPVEWQGILGIKKLRDASPDWQAVNERILRDTAVRGSATDEIWLDLNDELDKIRAGADSLRNKAADVFVDPLSDHYMDGPNFRNMLARAGTQQSVQMATIRDEPRYKQVLDALDEKTTEKLATMEKGDMYSGDVAYLKYQREVVAKLDVPKSEGGLLDDETGEPDWDAVEAAKVALGPDREYVEARTRWRSATREPLAPAVQMYYSARDELLATYWAIPEKLFGKRSYWADLNAQLHARGELAKQRAVLSPAFVANARSMIASNRKAFKVSHPDADAMLALFYGSTPSTPMASMKLIAAQRLLTKGE